MATFNSVNNNISPVTTSTLTCSTGLTFDSTNVLDVYVPRTAWTPELKFGTGSTDIKYDYRTGHYSRIGDIVFFTGYIFLTNKGSSTGSAYIAVPYGTPTYNNYFVIALSDVDAPGSGYAYAVCRPSTDGRIAFLAYSGVTGNGDVITNAEFTNTSVLNFSGFYWI
jgi:hypothetical protein